MQVGIIFNGDRYKETKNSKTQAPSPYGSSTKEDRYLLKYAFFFILLYFMYKSAQEINYFRSIK